MFKLSLGLGINQRVQLGSNKDVVPFKNDLSTLYKNYTNQDVFYFFALGDSITEGVGTTTPKTDKYSTLISNALLLTDKSVAQSGGKIQVQLYEKRVAFIESFKNSIVYLAGGVNDCNYTEIENFGSRSNFVSKYTEIIDYIIAHGYVPAQMKIALIGYVLDSITTFVPTYNDMIKLIAASRSIAIVDQFSVNYNQINWSDDGLHPNTNFHKKIAQKILNSL